MPDAYNVQTMADHVRSILDPIEDRENAGSFHRAATLALRLAGHSVDREVSVKLPGRRGRLDLVVDGWFGIELDRVTPRRKSVAKIRAFGKGMIYCRHPRKS